MSKHTPGPWRVGPVDDTVVFDAIGNEVAAVDGDYNAPDTWPVMEANARLIAAAPELFGLAEQFIMNYDGMQDEDGNEAPELAIARAIVAKVRGGAA